MIHKYDIKNGNIIKDGKTMLLKDILTELRYSETYLFVKKTQEEAYAKGRSDGINEGFWCSSH